MPRQPNQDAKSLGKRGASQGGKVRAKKLSPVKRAEIARKGGKAGGKGRGKPR